MEKKVRGRKPKKTEDKVQARGVYLTNREWKAVEKTFGSPTKAMRVAVLPQCA